MLAEWSKTVVPNRWFPTGGSQPVPGPVPVVGNLWSKTLISQIQVENIVDEVMSSNPTSDTLFRQ